MIATGVVLPDICLRYFPVLQLQCLQNILHDSHIFRTSLTARLDYMDESLPFKKAISATIDDWASLGKPVCTRLPVFLRQELHGPNVYG